MRKAFVLLSGGLDSTTCLMKAIYDYAPDSPEDVTRRIQTQRIKGGYYDPIAWVEAVSINYGQRHIRESDCAAKTCADLGIHHHTIDVPGILGASLLTSQDEIPDVKYSDIEGVSPMYVPFRNGTMLSLITAYAQQWVNAENETLKRDIKFSDLPPQRRQDYIDISKVRPEAGVYFGAHAEDAHNWAYPDCTPEFIGAMSNAIYIGSYHAIRLHTPLMWLTKSEIVTLGQKLYVNFADTWSCYKGEQVHCGRCATCYARQTAFKDAGYADPTVYKLKETA